MEKRELKEALLNLGKAWAACAEIMDDAGFTDINDFILEKYPFEKSFTDYDINGWIENCVQALEEKKVMCNIQEGSCKKRAIVEWENGKHGIGLNVPFDYKHEDVLEYMQNPLYWKNGIVPNISVSDIFFE